MMNFTSNLYKTEWLELVFQNRNKTYGAYELRLHNNQTTVKSLIIASILFTSLIISPMVYDQLFKVDIVTPSPDVDPTVEIELFKRVEPIKPPVVMPPTQRSEPLKVIKSGPMVVVPAELHPQDPPTVDEMNRSVIGTENIDGKETLGTTTTPGPVTSEPSISTTPIVDNEVYNASTTFQAYPEFPGGQAAFAKFMSRNLRFPNMALEAGIFGKVFVSFIIEKNGELSNIKIMKGIGAGCDEEAIRVLSKSPKWKAGVQNDQNVRVMYTVPINFQLPEG